MGHVAQARHLPDWMTAAECLRFTRAFTTNFPNSQWLTVSDVLPMPTGFAHWKFVSFAVFTALIGLLAGGLTVVYDCKELE